MQQKLSCVTSHVKLTESFDNHPFSYWIINSMCLVKDPVKVQ